MTINKFIELVEMMRIAQKSYFKAQHGSREKQVALSESKRLEKEVDNQIESFKKNQSSLFKNG